MSTLDLQRLLSGNRIAIPELECCDGVFPGLEIALQNAEPSELVKALGVGLAYLEAHEDSKEDRVRVDNAIRVIEETYKQGNVMSIEVKRTLMDYIDLLFTTSAPTKEEQ